MAGKVTLVTDAPPEVAANFFPAEVDKRLTVMAVLLVVALPKVSSSVTVKAPVAEEPAVVLMGLEVICSCAPVPAVMLKALVVAAVRKPLVAVRV